jgi:hypothetical protein
MIYTTEIMTDVTIKEISERLGISHGYAKMKLHGAGIKPLMLIGNTGIYDPTVI